MANEPQDPEPTPDSALTAFDNDSGSKHHRRLSPAQIVSVMALHEQGKSGPEIASVIGCHHSQVYRTLQAYSSTTTLARQFLDGQSLAAAKQWAKAVRKGAERGRHEPARDLLLHNGTIQPVASADSGAKVAVFIGLPGAEQPQLLVQTHDVVVEATAPPHIALEDDTR